MCVLLRRRAFVDETSSYNKSTVYLVVDNYSQKKRIFTSPFRGSVV